MSAKKEHTADVVDVEVLPVVAGGPGEGRDGLGRFLPGVSGNTNGNPNLQRVHEFRNAILSATSKEDLLEVWAVLIEHAKAGEKWAVCELLDRCVGKEVAALILQQNNSMDAEDLIKIVRGIDRDRL